MQSERDPSKPTIIYDGECRFCIGRVNSIRAMDKAAQFSYIARQDPQAEERFPQIKGFKLDDGILLIEPSDQRIYVAADAIYHIARRLPGLMKLAWLYRVPGLTQLFQMGYRLVAANRRRIGQTCDSGTCKLP